jgi:serine/threonine protein kinase
MNTVDEIRGRLIESGVISAETIESQLAAWGEQAEDTGDGDDLLSWLVEQQKIGELQAEAIASGHVGPVMLGAYRLLEPIAQCRLGQIFRAVQDEFKQHVSLKVFVSGLTDSPELLAEVQRELRVSVQLDHPNVVRTFEVGRVADTYFLAMEDMQGETLAARLAREGQLPYATACKLMCDVARALVQLHEQEIIHRDLHPDTIWITSSGSAKIIDFSAAKDPLAFLDTPEGDEEAAAASTGDEFAGTFGYMAPEQALDPSLAEARSDIYSLACVLYECLTGQPPFVNSDAVRLMMRHALEIPTPANELVEEVPQSVAETVSSMLAKDPAERFKSAQDLIWTLEQFFEKQDESIDMVKLVGATEFNPEYLDWCRQKSAEARQTADLDQTVGITPELVTFLNRMTRKHSKRR